MQKQTKYKSKPVRYVDVATLESRIHAETPSTGEYLYNYKLELIKKENATLPEKELKKLLKMDFTDLPISSLTLKSLVKRGFKTLTEIQRCTIPHALAGRDILAASKTGSGKTLAYLIPIIENLYRIKWTPMDRIGALIIVPTRELGVQVFEVLGSLLENCHELSYGLIIGGKSYESERKRINSMNIVICTPGRLLQHFNETEYFDCDNLKMLVIDEADEILSMGFEQTLDSILQCLPSHRQNMLFSATLTKKIMHLSKIALCDPENIILHSKDAGDKADDIYETPVRLTQYYTMVPHHDKINMLFSFIKNQQNTKIIVFVSCCKQVRFIYEAFKTLRIGVPLFEYHGRQTQPKRMAIFFQFTESRSAILFTTNIAARGLDFPKVDWVLQFDCPDTIETYVHRMGRTARFSASGKSLLILDPSEQTFIDKVKQKGFTVNKITPNPDKQLSILKTLQGLCLQQEEVKYLGQRAFISFVKNVFKMPDKDVFDVSNINFKLLANSYGLIQTPVVKVADQNLVDEEEAQAINDGPKLTKNQKKLQKLKSKISAKGNTELADQVITRNISNKLNKHRETQKIAIADKINEKEEDADDFLLLKRKDNQIPEDQNDIPPMKPTKLTKNKKIKIGSGNVYDIDDEGNLLSKDEKFAAENKATLEKYAKEDTNYLDQYKQKLINNENKDKMHNAERIRSLRKRQKEKKSEHEDQVSE